MGHSSAAKHTKTWLLSNVLDQISESQMETMEILSDVDQMVHLMTSLLETNSGQIVSFDAAFSDL